MGTGGRRGRRDNGLEASEYAVAGDVDPRVGEHLLDVLAAGGIAAYLQPAADLHPITRTTTVPSRPTDRLYVDREHLGTAREYLTQLTAPTEPAPVETGTTATDVDAAWELIVADLRSDLDPRTSTWPDPDKPAKPDAPARPASTGTTTPAEEPSLLDGLDTFGVDLPDEDEGTYTPPPPPPLPRLSKTTVAALIAILAGFILFIWPSLLPIGENLARFTGFAACFAGVGMLIWRLRPGNDDEDYRDPDDGAVV